MPTDSPLHLIVPFAQYNSDGWLTAVTALELKNLGQLLRGMDLLQADFGRADTLSTPHERALAMAWGLKASNNEGKEGTADGLIPLAAVEASAKPNEGWAFITPCHWAMGREHATLSDASALEITEAQSRTLLAAMQPYFATEGITLHFAAHNRWLAQGDVFRSLPTASLDRVLGRNVDAWLPKSKHMKLLQNEMQMLLYTHPINDERATLKQRSINSFWLSGSGALSEPFKAHPQVAIAPGLSPAALADDWVAYGQAWKRLDDTEIAQLLSQQKSNVPVRISLCGESNAMTFQTAQQSIFSKFKGVLRRKRPIDVLKQL